jgi:dipeptidyl aminopeptidase/acylaminoacyl peptidase
LFKRNFCLSLRIVAMIVATFVLFATAYAQTKLLRFPDLHGDRVAFTYAGDLWTAAASGGAAIRLTAHPGMEVFAKFSPDGKWIAFTGQYDGDEQVYVMPAGGGEPRQLTFYPSRRDGDGTIRFTAGRATVSESFSNRSRIPGPCRLRASIQFQSTGGRPKLCQCRKQAREIIRRIPHRWSTRLSLVIFDPRSGMAAVKPIAFIYSI